MNVCNGKISATWTHAVNHGVLRLLLANAAHALAASLSYGSCQHPTRSKATTDASVSFIKSNPSQLILRRLTY